MFPACDTGTMIHFVILCCLGYTCLHTKCPNSAQPKHSRFHLMILSCLGHIRFHMRNVCVSLSDQFCITSPNRAWHIRSCMQIVPMAVWRSSVWGVMITVSASSETDSRLTIHMVCMSNKLELVQFALFQWNGLLNEVHVFCMWNWKFQPWWNMHLYDFARASFWARALFGLLLELRPLRAP